MLYPSRIAAPLKRRGDLRVNEYAPDPSSRPTRAIAVILGCPVACRGALKENPARRGAEVKEARVGLSRFLQLVPAEARSNRRPRPWSHLFGLIQLCGLAKEEGV